MRNLLSMSFTLISKCTLLVRMNLRISVLRIFLVHQFFVHIVMFALQLVNISKTYTSNQLSICVENKGKNKTRLDLNYINNANIVSKEEMQLIEKIKKRMAKVRIGRTRIRKEKLRKEGA
jgi:hypothetical protein